MNPIKIFNSLASPYSILASNIHYSLEYDHVHLLIEADNNTILEIGMRVFGGTLVNAVNKMRGMKGSVYKLRYHFRQISSVRQLKNVMRYIFLN
ncbi:MAG: transposase [Bacteriovorax sp.]|nr:transposase [Bacteriovorax sp.]